MAETLEFWFDFASTYSYLSAMRIEEKALARGVEIKWKPFLLGPIFAKQGWTSSPFVVYPAKGRYMMRDLERLAVLEGVPFDPPSEMPARSMLASRLALVGLEEGWGVEFCKAVFMAEFGKARDISDENLLKGILRDMNQDDALTFSKALHTENKQRLKDQTVKAENLGIFGAPMFVCDDGELFWGHDRLDHALVHASL